MEDIKATFRGKCYMQHHKPAEETFLEANPWISGIQGVHGKGLGTDKLHFGSNSGFQAINLCYLLGAKRIFLVGYDMKSERGGKQHWFGNHPPQFGQGNYGSFIPYFTSLAVDLERRGIDVVNLSRDTALHQFPRATMDDFD